MRREGNLRDVAIGEQAIQETCLGLEIVLGFPATKRRTCLGQPKDSIDRVGQAVLLLDQEPGERADTILPSAHTDLIRHPIPLKVKDCPVCPLLHPPVLTIEICG